MVVVDVSILQLLGVMGGAAAATTVGVAAFTYKRGKDIGKSEAVNGLKDKFDNCRTTCIEAIGRLSEHQIDQDRRLNEGHEQFNQLVTGQQSIKAEIILTRSQVNSHSHDEYQLKTSGE
jgi:hypothetical protein